MKQSIFWLGWAAPVMLLAAGPVLAQQTVPPRGGSPSGVNDSNQTRGLESEIEQYPGRSDGMRGDSASDARIPEELQPPPRKPSQAPRSQATTPAAPGRGGAPASTDARSSIDPSEVQRVFGTDAQIVSSLKAFDRLATRGIVVNDLVRSRRAYIWTWLFTWPFHPILHHDGPLSIRRALRPAEMQHLARSHPGATW